MNEDICDNKLVVSKRIFENLSFSLQLLVENISQCIQNIDTSSVEDVSYCNGIIDKLNELIDSIKQNQGIEFKSVEYINLTDEEGNIVTEDKLWVVGNSYVENEEIKYYKCRKVKARTMKEAIYKYCKENTETENTVLCFGIFDEMLEYSKNIENVKVIE